MKTLDHKAIIFDDSCPMCNWYTGAFIQVGVLGKEGRISFRQADESIMSKLDMNRARHEIPLIDTQTGEVLYGLDGLTLVVGNIFPVLKPLITTGWFKTLLKPLYQFISYNRRVIADSHYSGEGFNCAPDFSLAWRLALIVFGISYTGAGIYLFGVLTGIANLWLLFTCVASYFVLLMTVNFTCQKTFLQKLDYTAHLSVLGIIESTLFIVSALIAKATGMLPLLFAAQGAIRLFALSIHAKRITNNGFAPALNYAFAIGAVALIIYLAVILR